MKHFKPYIALLLLLSMPILAQKKGKQAEDPTANIQNFVYQMMTEWKVPGCAISIVKDGKSYFNGGFGLKNQQTKQAVTAQTLFPIASCSKSFTAAALAILVDEGKIEWNKPVKNYLPDFQLSNIEAEHLITVRDLLSHRTGLPRHDFVWLFSNLNRQAIYERLKYLQLSKQPYDQYQYNNLMYMVAGILVEKVAGKSWEAFVKERILTPLNMNSTVLTYPELFKSTDYALSYKEDKGNWVEVGFASNVDAIGPAGAIKSNTIDMTNWLLLQLQKGKFNDQPIISEKNLKENHTPIQVVWPAEAKYPELGFATYGMGWNLNVYRGAQRSQHNGSIEGYRSQMTVFPNNGLGIFITTNTSDADYFFVNTVTNYIADQLLELNSIDWNQRYKKDREDARFEEEKKTKAMAANRKIGAAMSHHIDFYTGIFEHPAYGILQIYKTDRGLRATYHNRSFELTHFHYDYFMGNELWENVPLEFESNLKGEIYQIKASIPNAGEIIFNKK
ncbi:serine hydrolase [Flectobacillus major]|jgi:CubicO group peptidase (beta-lactamase class C family)|uniref:serine hydrolase n=1 Tax=Flectobacillus major TaxID=103 RepID=UPI00042A0987|nr:serine hydrolase [Flectobacillus major]